MHESFNFLQAQQYMLWSIVLIVAILMDIKWCLTKVFICIFLMTSDVE